MIKFEYIPWTADRPWGYAEDVPSVESVTMTLGHDVTWEEATREFHNFLRAAGYVISYDFEEEETDRLREKKKQIYEDLKDDINEWSECTPEMHRDTMQNS